MDVFVLVFNVTIELDILIIAIGKFVMLYIKEKRSDDFMYRYKDEIRKEVENSYKLRRTITIQRSTAKFGQKKESKNDERDNY